MKENKPDFLSTLGVSSCGVIANSIIWSVPSNGSFICWWSEHCWILTKMKQASKLEFSEQITVRWNYYLYQQILVSGSKLRFLTPKSKMAYPNICGAHMAERIEFMKFDKNLKKLLWAEAVETAAHMVNRSLSMVLTNQTPFEERNCEKPSTTNLKIIISWAMVK